MKEEINNLNTDLKEMFIEEKYDEIDKMIEVVDKTTINEIILYNWNIINKYYIEKNYNILAQYIKFVAFNCFLTEKANNKQYIEENVYVEMMEVYENISEEIKK